MRDAVIDYITAMGTVSRPRSKAACSSSTTPWRPSITITAPVAKVYRESDDLTIAFDITDAGSGVRSVEADLDGAPVTNAQVIDLMALAYGSHTVTVHAVDMAWNETTESVTFTVKSATASLKALVAQYTMSGAIKKPGISKSLVAKLDAAQAYVDAGDEARAISTLNSFIQEVKAQAGKSITPAASASLVAMAQEVIASLQ